LYILGVYSVPEMRANSSITVVQEQDCRSILFLWWQH